MKVNSIERKDQLLKIDEVLRLYPVSKSSWYRGVKSGIYPTPFKLGRRSVAWLQKDIVDLLMGLQQKGVSHESN